MVSASERAAITKNLFPAALEAIPSWDDFPWHRDGGGRITADRPWSSQALAVDVFGTVSLLGSREAIANSWMSALGLPEDANWQFSLEWLLPDNPLHEPRRTQVDATACASRTLVLFECKFTERAGGRCSQTTLLTRGSAKGKRQCDGSYKLQTNPFNGLQGRCALTEKGIKYWTWIPDVLSYSATADYSPCPFVGGAFQWMRNVVAAAAVAKPEDRKPVFVLVHAGERGSGVFPIAREVASDAWESFRARAEHGPVAVRAISYSELLQHAAGAATQEDQRILKQLRGWVSVKEGVAEKMVSSLATAGSHGA